VALMPFATIGYPDFETSIEIVKAMVAAGADAIELGIPFSDPLADGPTIQKASYAALQGGTTPAHAIDIVQRLREAGVAVPRSYGILQPSRRGEITISDVARPLRWSDHFGPAAGGGETLAICGRTGST
jgi:hypothetical protein